MFEKYKNHIVKFCGYYKYTFTFTATLPNGNTLIVQVGGCSDSIYRLAVSPDMTSPVANLQPVQMMEIDSEGIVVDVWEDSAGDF